MDVASFISLFIPLCLSLFAAIAVLKDKEPGSFLIRDSNSFQGAYGLALKVAYAPPNASNHGSRGDPLEQLVRHFLIETGARGVKIKGCQNESYFGKQTVAGKRNK